VAFIFNCVSAQNDPLLPEDMYKKEIRIFIYSPSNHESRIIRIYEDFEANTVMKIFRSDQEGKLSVAKEKQIEDANFWSKLDKTQIMNIANEEDIAFKFKNYKDVEIDGSQVMLAYEKPDILGEKENYGIVIRDGDRFNHVKYSNPDFYLSLYPEIDELNSIVSALNLIRNVIAS